jgi:hypothetical protein
MSITVFEATKLDTFKNFRLIAGHRGLDNIVKKIGILDYEFITKIEEQFAKGEFVISSLFFAKDNPEFILEAVKELEKDGVSGLAIKNIYFNEIPLEVVNYANEKSFPIFIFDNSVYFEDIITEVADKIRAVNNYELLETKIDILIKRPLNKATVRDIALEINSSFKEDFFVLYCKRKKYIDNNMVTLLGRITRSKNINIHSSALKYRNGILVIFTDEDIDKKNIKNTVNSIIEGIGITPSEYFIGVSGLHTKLEELANGINESIFAQRTCEVSNTSFNHFSDIGIYSILMPFIDEIWIRNFHDRIIMPIKNYDEKYNTQLFDTAIKYIDNDGKIIETANEFFLHKNTIRYRIGKIKEILNMEHCEGSFYEQLSIAIKLYKIYNI